MSASDPMGVLTRFDPRAEQFVRSRLGALALDTFPGSSPETSAEAYCVQDDAIRLWPDQVVGWKVGGIGRDWRAQAGADRLVGPIFSRLSHNADGEVTSVPVFADGFAAFEGEVTAVIGRDVPAGQRDFTREDAIGFIASLNLGVEIASSPFAGINDHGPLVTISDFGNNQALILGDVIPGWEDLDVTNWMFETHINGELAGCGRPDGLPGGPVESVRFALENTARRGLPIRAGMRILTGAVTGVHRARVGDTAQITCTGCRPILCKLTSAMGQAEEA